MPAQQQNSYSSEMASDLSPDCGLSDLGRGDSLERSSSGSRSRSFTLDDESLKYLTHEEKDVIMFFEETIDSLEDDFEEQVLCDSGVHCHFPWSLEESTYSHSEPEDVIDLVQPGPSVGGPECPLDETEAAGAESVGKEDVPLFLCRKQGAESPPLPDPPVPQTLPLPLAPAHPRKELPPPSPPAEHPKLPRSVPTPLVIAQKISEKLAGREALLHTSPSKDGRPGEWRTLALGGPGPGDHFLWHRHVAPPVPKVHRFPSNISVTNSAGKDFNKTISKAAVNVQERKARVLANINGVSFLSTRDLAGRALKGGPSEQTGSVGAEQGPRGTSGPAPVREAAPAPAEGRSGGRQSRAVQTEQAPPLANGCPSIHDALRSQPGAFASAGKTVAFRPTAAPAGKLALQNASKSLDAPRQPDCGQDARRRAGSLPRAVGVRPQGVTVQFAGRGATEEARREALRKLGLLKKNS
nr:proline and serine-rich protein 2 [Manis javanica]